MVAIFESVNNKMFIHVPDHSKTQEMYDKVVEKDLEMLIYVSDDLKTQIVCEFFT